MLAMILSHRYTIFEIELTDGRWMRVTATIHGLIVLIVVVGFVLVWRECR